MAVGMEVDGNAGDGTTGFDVRAELEAMLERNLVGPLDGPAEELPPGTSPGERYLLAKLVPRRPPGQEPIESPKEDSEDDDVEDRPELVEEAGLDLVLTTTPKVPPPPRCGAGLWRPHRSGLLLPCLPTSTWSPCQRPGAATSAALRQFQETAYRAPGHGVAPSPCRRGC